MYYYLMGSTILFAGFMVFAGYWFSEISGKLLTLAALAFLAFNLYQRFETAGKQRRIEQNAQRDAEYFYPKDEEKRRAFRDWYVANHEFIFQFGAVSNLTLKRLFEQSYADVENGMHDDMVHRFFAKLGLV